MGAEWVKQQLLAAGGLVPNKALGQNFLVDEGIIEAILSAAKVTGQSVLEVGPGLGALTEGLICRAGRVVAVEKDKTLSALLSERLEAENFTIVTGDFLHVDVPALFQDGEDYAAVGNLPYYVTTPISEKLITCQPASITLMVQKEAAARYTALPGERVYGPLSVLAGCYYSTEHCFYVGPEAFYPRPEVESAVVRLERKGQPAPQAQQFLSFLNRTFAMRRKTIYNNLKDLPGLPEALEELSLSPSVRAEALPPGTLLALFERTRQKAPGKDKGTTPQQF